MAPAAPACRAVPPLAGWRIGVTADRRADEQVELLRRRGADVVHAPVVRTLPFDDDRRLRAATDSLLADRPDVVVATTGIGVRAWVGAAESWGADAALLDALRPARIHARGPKARAGLVGVGLRSDVDEPTERLDPLVDRLVEHGVDGARIAVQLYGEDRPAAVDRLRLAGAEVVEVPVYRWTRADDLAPARRLLDAVVAGQLDAVTFTSAAAVRVLHEVAADAGIGAAVASALSTTVVAACVGPVTAEAATACGYGAVVGPSRGRLGLLVRRLSDELHHRHVHLRATGGEVVVQGASVWGEGADVTVGGREGAVLSVLVERAGVVVPRSTLRRRVWADGCADGAVDRSLSRLRSTLRPVGLDLVAVPRRGWVLPAAVVACPA